MLADWKDTRLGDAIALQRGYDLPHRDRRPGGVPVVSSCGITSTHDKSLVRGPGVVTGRYGTIGEVFYVTEDFWPLNTTLFVKEFKGNDPLYVAYLLRTIDYGSYSGKSGVPGVNRNDLHEIAINLPPVPEQRSIASALSDIDALIGTMDRLILKKSGLRRAAAQQLLTGKRRLPGFGRASPRDKQTDVGPIPEDWDCTELRELNPFVTSGSRGWARFYSDRGSPFIRITNMTRRRIELDLRDLKFVTLPSDDREGTRTELQRDDVLISITADIGIVSYVSANVPKPAYINQHIALVRFDPSKTSGKYVSNFLASERPQRFFRESTDVGAKAGMNLATVRKLRVALPSFLEQCAIATALGDMDAEISVTERQRDKIRFLKQGMMQELLTGRIRLV